MSGYQGRGGSGGGSDRYSRDRGGERRRSRSPGRDQPRDYRRGPDSSRGSREDYAPEGASQLPPLPQEIAIPKHGRKLPYPVKLPRSEVGSATTFAANHFVIASLPTIKIYQYELKFVVPPESQARGSEIVTAQQMARVLLDHKLNDFLGPNFVFDGVSLGWSPDAIVAVEEEKSSTLDLGKRRDGKPNEVRVSVKNTGTLDIKELVMYISSSKMDPNPMGNQKLEPTLKWLQALLRKGLSHLVTRPNSNAYFDRSVGSFRVLQSTGGVLEARRGIFHTMQVRFEKLTVNVDTATTPFWVPDKPLIDFISALIGLRDKSRLEQEFLGNPDRFFQACGKILGIYFCVKHLTGHMNTKKIKFTGWCRSDANGTTFEEEVNGVQQTTSVADYYMRRYNIRLQYPRLPLAHSRAGDFPLELCFSAADERYKDVLQGVETADFIKYATAPAHERKKQIYENVKKVAWHNQTILQAHGVSVEPKMMEVKARVLPPPRVIYGSGPVSSNDGQWNLRGIRFLAPATIRSWAIICFGDAPQQVVQQFAGEILKGFRNVGMGVPRDPPIPMMGNPYGDMRETMASAIDKAKAAFGGPPDVIFHLLKGSSIPIYQAIKSALDVHLGIASQVMLMDKALGGRGQAQYIANIALKVNVKLGGTNSTIDENIFKQGRFMLIGGDLSMASPSAIRRDPPPPTTAVLTGTYDKQCTKYTAVASMQPTSQTGTMEHAAPMFKELLKRYREKNDGKMPQHIIYFRDGTSESEFVHIRDKEGRPLKELTQEFGTKITLIIAVKRHHTRFMAEGQFATKLGNVPPGTVVENFYTKNDSYIITHRDLQGTKRPTRYVSIVDENNFPPDVFNRLIYGLCSTYARATTSVAVVPPIYYADQACERARIHLEDKQDGSKFLPEVHDNLKWRMYWQ